YGVAGSHDLTEYVLDPATGLAQTAKTIRNDALSVLTKYTRDPDGTLAREDFFDQNNAWIGATEYANGLEVVTRYKWPDGQTFESRPSFDARRMERERSFSRNGSAIGKF